MSGYRSFYFLGFFFVPTLGKAPDALNTLYAFVEIFHLDNYSREISYIVHIFQILYKFRCWIF